MRRCAGAPFLREFRLAYHVPESMRGLVPVPHPCFLVPQAKKIVRKGDKFWVRFHRRHFFFRSFCRTFFFGARFAIESFHGVALPTFLNEIAGFKTSCRSYLLKHGVPRHPDVVDRYTFAHKNIYIWKLFFNSILPCVEQPCKRSLKKPLVLGGGTIAESARWLKFASKVCFPTQALLKILNCKM